MALLDRSFRGKCTPEILTFQRVADIQKGEGDLRVELSESELARYIYTYLHIIYTISTHRHILYIVCCIGNEGAQLHLKLYGLHSHYLLGPITLSLLYCFLNYWILGVQKRKTRLDILVIQF